MKRIGLVLFCGVLGCLLHSAPAQADAVDDLLNGPAIVSADTGDSALEERTGDKVASDSGIADDGLLSESRDWQSDLHKSVVPHEPSHAANSESLDHSAAPAVSINMVPEPSAIALAGVALLYFMVFGRRQLV